MIEEKKNNRYFYNALVKYGRVNFLVQPIYYCDNTTDLNLIETDLINCWNSLHPNGYNICAAHQGAGPYGEAFSQLAREAQLRPEVRAKLAITNALPETKARKSAAAKLSLNDPSVIAKISEGVLAAFPKGSDKLLARNKAIKIGLSKPGAKEKMRIRTEKHNADPIIRAAITAGVSKPEVRAKMSASHTKRYEDPNERKKTGDAIRLAHTPERGAKISRSRLGKIWITNGTKHMSIQSTEQIPNGWWKGMKKNNYRASDDTERNSKIASARAGTIAITNGAVSRWIRPEEVLPPGWRRGRK